MQRGVSHAVSGSAEASGSKTRILSEQLGHRAIVSPCARASCHVWHIRVSIVLRECAGVPLHTAVSSNMSPQGH